MRTNMLDTHAPVGGPAGTQRPDDDGGSTQRRRAGWWVLVAVGGAAVLAALGWGTQALVTMVDTVEAWPRAEVPGQVEVTADEPGALVVRSEATGTVQWGSPGTDLEVSVRGPDGERMPVEDVSTAFRYRVPGRTGTAVARFNALVAGDYQVTVEGTATSRHRVAVGEPLWPDTLRVLVAPGALGLGGVLVAVGGAVGLVVTRRREDSSPGGHTAGRPRRRPQARRPSRRRAGTLLLGYAALTLGLTWVVWIPALTLLGEAAMPLVMLGAFGPAIAAALLVRAEGGRVRGWLRDRLRFRLAARWYVAALTLPLLEPVVTTIVAVSHGASLALGELPARLPLVLASFVVVLLIGGGQEELGWRGYLLPRLQAQVGPLSASLAVGVLWAVWHLPLFTLGMSGYTYQSVPFVLYLLILVAVSVAFTWLFNRTGGSVVVVMLLHAAVNNWDSLAPVPASLQLDGRVELLSQLAVAVGYALVAVVLVWLAGTRLGAHRRSTLEDTRATSEPAGA